MITTKWRFNGSVIWFYVVSLGESWNNNGDIDGLAFQIFQQSHGLLANPPFRSMIFPAVNFHLVQGVPITMFDFNLSRKVGVKTICSKSLKINSQGFHKQMLCFLFGTLVTFLLGPAILWTWFHRWGFIIEGSLEVKLPTIWRDEKQSREEAERRERLEERRVEEKE